MENIILPLARPLPLLSLQEWTVIKLTTSLLYNQQLLTLIMDFRADLRFRLYAKMGEEWRAVLSLANELLSRICNCTKLKEMILELLWPLSNRIILFKYTFPFPTVNNIVYHFYWTGRGKIDNIRTARYIIGNENIYIGDRFILACSFCLREEVYELWSIMSREERDFYEVITSHREVYELWNIMLQEERDFYVYINSQRFIPLLSIWVNDLKGITYVNEVDMFDALETATNLRMLEAMEYLFSISTEEHSQNDMALRCFDVLSEIVNVHSFLEEDEIEMCYLLFPKISQDNQIAMFATNSQLILFFILHSSEREYFLKNIAERFPFTSTTVIRTLLHNMFYNYHLEIRKDHDYYQLFIDVWRRIPETVRNSIKANTSFGMNFLSLMIKGELRYLLEREVWEKTDEHDASDFEAYPSITPYCFDEDKREFLRFLISEKIVTIPSLLE